VVVGEVDESTLPVPETTSALSSVLP
jgi:hypothetical protein